MLSLLAIFESVLSESSPVTHLLSSPLFSTSSSCFISSSFPSRHTLLQIHLPLSKSKSAIEILCQVESFRKVGDVWMLEVYLPAAGCVVVGLLHGLKYSCRKDKTWHRVAATALFGAGGIGYIKIYRGDRDWFRYVPYAKQPTYMKQNFPFYVSSYCFAFLGCFGTRETYVRFMSRYLLPPK